MYGSERTGQASCAGSPARGAADSGARPVTFNLSFLRHAGAHAGLAMSAFLLSAVAEPTPPPSLQWFQRLGAEAQDLVPAPGGGWFLTGGFHGLGRIAETSPVSVGQGDLFLARFDALGRLQWIRTAGGAGDEVGRRLAVDQQGNIAVLGLARGGSDGIRIAFGSTEISTPGDTAPFIARYTSGGQLLWARIQEGVVDADLLSGDASGTLVFSGRDASGAPLLRSLAAGDGQVRWSVAPGGPGRTEITSLTSAPDGSTWIGCTTLGATRFGSFLPASDGTLLVRLGAGGLFQGVNRLGPGITRIGQMAFDPSGNLLLAGTYDGRSPDAQGLSFGPVTLNGAGKGEGFLLKLSPEGSPLWGLRAGGAGDDSTGRFSPDGQGGVALPISVVGNASIDSTPLPGVGSRSYLAHVNSGGTVDWVSASHPGGMTCAGVDSQNRIALLCDSDGTPVALEDPAYGPPAVGPGRLIEGLGIDPGGPYCVVQPVGGVFAPGSFVELRVTAGGLPSFQYQWSFNGRTLPGENRPVLVRAELSAGESGVYRVAVCNGLGCTESVEARLEVAGLPPPAAVDWVRQPWEGPGSATGAAWPNLVEGATDGAGNLYLLCALAGGGSFEGIEIPTPHGGAGFLLASYTPAGILRWGVMDGTGGSATPLHLAVDPAGNSCVTGWQPSGATFAGFVARYSPAGRQLWATATPGVWRGGVATDAAGNAFVLSSEGSHAFLEAFSPAGAGQARVDLAGWLGASAIASGPIAADPQGNSYLILPLANPVTQWGNSYQPTGKGDVVIAKFHPEGGLAWARQLRANGSVRLFDLSVNAAGEVGVCGALYGGLPADLGGRVLTPSSAFAPFVARYAADGSLLWARPVEADFDFLGGYARVLTDRAGGLVAAFRCGTPFALGNIPFSPSPGGNLFVTRWTPTGEIDWVRQGESDAGQVLAGDPNGGLYLGGTVEGTLHLGAETRVADLGGHNRVLWVARLLPRPRLQLTPGDGGGLQLEVTGDYAGLYDLEWSSDLHDWTFLGTYPASGEGLELPLLGPSSDPQRYYRARIHQ